MTSKIRNHLSRLRRAMRNSKTSFQRDEDGNVLVLGLFMFVGILVAGGMAVDFMRLESRRALLQSTADRAVLAAADMGQEMTPAEIVVDVFTKAGLEDYIAGTPSYSSDAYLRTVSVETELVMNTYFLHWLNIPQLAARADSAAKVGLGKIEVSLVLDLSGSMEDPSDSGATKLFELQKAANNFVGNLLAPETVDRVSISLIPYSEHVNAGQQLMTGMNTNQVHNWSHCVEFADSEFSSAALNTSIAHQQAQHYQFNSDWNGSQYLNTTTDTVCPRYDYEEITPFSNNAAALTAQINALQPRAGTAIFLGMKWGAGLLDPSARPMISSLISSGAVSAQFAGRPTDYTSAGAPNNVAKFIVLMTDGKNSSSSRLRSDLYDTPSKRAHWVNANLWWHIGYNMGWYNYSGMYVSRYTSDPLSTTVTKGDDLLKNICDAAKSKGIVIYSVPFEAPAEGEAALKDCASSDDHYFPAAGDALDEIFQKIASQITQLRLTQ